MIVLFHLLYYVGNTFWNKVKSKLIVMKGLVENNENSYCAKRNLSALEAPEEGCENTSDFDDYDPTRDVCVYDQLSGKLTFVPPLYIQRYQTVVRVLSDHVGKIDTIAEFGCAEFAMIQYYKRQPGVTKVLFVDIDQELLEHKSHRVEPLTVEYMKERETALTVDVLCGDVSVLDERMRQADVVVAIELIEHLYPPTLENVPFNLFGYIQPSLVIITTPNGEFNYLFEDYVEGTFRHDDHKFEWSRDQFANWAENIITRFPNYSLQISGIGPPPSSQSIEQYGHCSQMAVFTRVGPRMDHVDLPQCNPQPYKPIKQVIYPVKPPETRTREQILFDELTYLLFSWNEELVPLRRLYAKLSPWCASVEHLREILERNCRRVMLNEEELCLINDEYLNTSRYSTDEEEESGIVEEESSGCDHTSGWGSWEEPYQKDEVPVNNYSNTWESWDEPVSTDITEAQSVLNEDIDETNCTGKDENSVIKNESSCVTSCEDIEENKDVITKGQNVAFSVVSDVQSTFHDEFHTDITKNLKNCTEILTEQSDKLVFDASSESNISQTDILNKVIVSPNSRRDLLPFNR